MIKTLEKYPIISLTIIILLMLLTHLDVPNITIMEARNFISSREMIQDNNWILTTMNGEPRYQKPPLPTWLTAVSGLLFGANNLTALRLPTVFMVMFLGIYCYCFCLKLKLSKNHSFRNSLILVTSFYVIGILSESPWDIFAHSFMFAGIYYLFNLFEKDTSIWKNSILAAFLFGFSLLSKGPVSLFAVFLPFIISYGIVFKFKNFKQKLVPFLSFIFLFIIIGSWWFVYVRYVDSEAFLATVSTETSNWSSYNVKPFYYYWSFFVQSGLWTIPAFIGLLYPYMIKRVAHKKVYRFSFLWTLIAVLLISSIPEKKTRYLMPVLIPLAINTGFYIQYLIKSFSKISDRKEIIPVYFNFGLIATIGIAFPLLFFFVLNDTLELYLINYILTSTALVIIGVFMFRSLFQKNIKNTFYLSISFMVSIAVFGIPISKVFNKNKNYKTTYSLHQFEEKNSINTYSLGEIEPEMLWDYNGIIPNIYLNKKLTIPNELSFGLLITLENKELISIIPPNIYHLNLVETYNLNVGLKNKERLVGEFYLVSKK